MRLSTTLDNIYSKIGYENSIKLLKEVGFDAFDMPFFGMAYDKKHPMNGDNYLEFAKEIRSYADKYGLPCNQAHAPFGSSNGDPEFDKYRFDQLVRSMEGASVMGADVIVIHPKQHLKYSLHAEELKQMNIEFYKSLVPYCEKFGIKVAVENMWQYEEGVGVVDSTCSQAREFCEYVDAINSPWVIACLDVGHVVITGEDMDKIITSLGSRLQALHVHDNDRVNDTHTLPYTLKIDFDGFATSLGKIGYEHDFTFEAASFLARFPKELLPSALRLMHDTGRHIMSLIKK